MTDRPRSDGAPAGAARQEGAAEGEPPRGDSARRDRPASPAASPAASAPAPRPEESRVLPSPTQAPVGQPGAGFEDIPTGAPEPQPRAAPTLGSPFAGLLAEAAGTTPPVLEAGLRYRDKAGSTAENPRLERRIGPYRILEELGSGGMAVVYKALQPSLDRLVAVKELRPEYVHDKHIAARFAREAASLAALQHGNIVHIFDYLYDLESAHIVMEYVDGIDLFDLLVAAERLPPEIAASIAVQIADGLEYAHYRGIVHRDIKPSNILISKRGEVKIMDFGIARDPGNNSELTQVGIAVGTPAYMAPEQIRGDRIDFRTDVFALGIVLYEMLTGAKPWAEEEGRSVTVKVLDEEHTPIDERLPSVPPELSRIIRRCLNKDPKERYKTTHELRRELEVFVNRAVPIDPRGRIVLFLRNRGLILEADASNFVAPALFADVSLRCIDQGVPLPEASSLLKPVGIASGVSFFSVAVAALLAIFVPFGERLPELPPPVVAPLRAEPSKPPEPAGSPDEGTRVAAARGRGRFDGPRTGNEGFIRVVVDPWGRVFVDGEFYDVTPFAESIALPPGRHRLAVRNPYFRPEDRYVDVETGKTEVVKISLLPRDEGEEPAHAE